MTDTTACRKAFDEEYGKYTKKRLGGNAPLDKWWMNTPGNVWRAAWQASRSAIVWPDDMEIRKVFETENLGVALHWLKEKMK